MKRALFSSLVLSALSAGCNINLPVDNKADNPQVFAPLGAIRGFANYIGPGPCIRKGEVEGALILLLFNYDNPPPPNGLATTAENFVTIPGEALFQGYPRPTSGPGSPGSQESLCPGADTPLVNYAAAFSLQQLNPGRYMVRAFYSRQNRFNPLYNFANLPLAGDVGGGAVDLTQASRPFVPIEIGTLCTAKSAVCSDTDVANRVYKMPDTGFVREGIAVTVGSVFNTSRPYFHVDYSKSFGFDLNGFPTNPDFSLDATESFARRKTAVELAKLAAPSAELNGGILTMRQDHVATTRQQLSCAGNPDPTCDIFKFAQASFLEVRLKYGFPGNSTNPRGGLPDAFLAKMARPSDPFKIESIRPYYGIDPFEFTAFPQSMKFALSRAVDSKGLPEILRDNKTLEDVAKIALLFPTVVASKQADGVVMPKEGALTIPEILEPPRSQTDPIVTIASFTVRSWPDGRGSMKATSEGDLTGGGLSDAATGGKDPLNSPRGVESTDGFTALFRPSVACIYRDDPAAKFRGTLATPAKVDPNKDGAKGALLEEEAILRLNANRLYGVVLGCLPPGAFSINVVYELGQAWSFPNLSGTCSYSTSFKPNEECVTPPNALSETFISKGFSLRPLLQSQNFFLTDVNGNYVKDSFARKIPQTITILPSDRCGGLKDESATSCNTDADCAAMTPFRCIAAESGKKSCDLNGNGKIEKGNVWITNLEHEDVNGNGLLDPGEDKNGNGKLDMKTPYACLATFPEWKRLYDLKKLPEAEMRSADRLYVDKK